MKFPTPLVPGRLVRRYKRFLADVVLEDGRAVTAHCPNPGSMMGLAEPGLRVWLHPNDDPRRKLDFGWRLIEFPGGGWCGIDTSRANAVVREALEADRIAPLAAYCELRAEVPYGAEKSRIDFFLSGPNLSDAYVEVKSVTLSRQAGLAEFPDSVTARGAKHLRELAAVAREGCRAVMLYLVQRTDCERFTLARDIDPAYALAFDAARDAGVEVLCYDTEIDARGITLGRSLAIL